jgi:methionyl-tRNA formyltransferase
LKIKQSKVIKNLNSKILPGETLSYSTDGWNVSCGENVLNLLEVQLEGKKTMSIKDFYLGIKKAPEIII